MSASPAVAPVQDSVPRHVEAAPPQPAPAPVAYNPPPPAQVTPSASLYVGELDPTVTEAMLFEIFNMIGPVASIRVCRDAVTRRSLGYAYVNYLNAQDGERALESLNYSLIKGRACRIMWSQRDPALRKTGQGNIFIKNLDEQIDNKALHDTFAAFGNVLSCKVATDDHGRSKGYGFVHYETAEAAETAIKAVNGMLLNDKKVFVGHHISRKERQSKEEERKLIFTNLYVKYLAPEVTQEVFIELFEQFGKVTSAVVQVDDQGKSLGFGFVNFENHEDAHKAVEALHDSEHMGRRLFVARAQKKAERAEELRRSYEEARREKASKYQGVNLYVKNLDDEVDDDRLRQEFEPFGTITSTKVMRDEKGTSKGFGFVCFSTPEEATKAVAEMNNKMTGSKPLYVALAQRRDVRRQQLEAQVAYRNTVSQQQPVYYPRGPGPMGTAPMGLGPMVPGTMVPGPMAYGMPGINRRPNPNYYPFPGYPGGQPRARPPPAGRGGHPVDHNPAPVNGAPRPNLPPQGAPVDRNPGGGQPPAPRAPPANPVPPAPASEVPSAATLAGLSLADQKQLLGEFIYMKIVGRYPELAGKITGMLLEMDNTELLLLLSNEEAFDAKVKEALAVLQDFSENVSK